MQEFPEGQLSPSVPGGTGEQLRAGPWEEPERTSGLPQHFVLAGTHASEGLAIQTSRLGGVRTSRTLGSIYTVPLNLRQGTRGKRVVSDLLKVTWPFYAVTLFSHKDLWRAVIHTQHGGAPRSENLGSVPGKRQLKMPVMMKYLITSRDTH